MNTFALSLKEEVYTQLDELDKKENDILKKAREGVTLLESSIEKMKAFIEGYDFKDEYEEIIFFKDIKPRISCVLIFYRQLYYIEINRPKGGGTAQAEYLKGELNKLARFFEENKQYYHYLRSGDCSMDEVYFLRGKPSLHIHTDNFYFERNASFSTNCDFKMAEILANDLLESHLVVEIDKLEGKDNGAGGYYNPFKAKLAWTGKKIDLIELIYALYLAKVFNHGKATLKEIIACFEQVFNIDLGANPSKSYTEVRERKGRIPFLKQLYVLLNKKSMD